MLHTLKLCFHYYKLFISNSATLEMIKCPVGTMRKTINGANRTTDCVPCTAGYYCLEGSATETGVCNVAFYCPSPIPNVYGTDPPLIGSYGNEQVRMNVAMAHTHPSLVPMVTNR